MTNSNLKALEQAVGSSNLATTMKECLWVGDKKHKTVYVNPEFERATGYSIEECIGKPCDFFFDEKGKETIAKHHQLRKSGQHSQYEANLIAKNGTIIPLLISGAPTETGGTVGVFTNLTTLKELSKKEKTANQIIQHSSEAIVILDSKRLIKLWNDGATKLFGYTEEEALEKSIDMVIPLDYREENFDLINEVHRKGQIKNIETKRLNKSGQYIDVSLSVSKVVEETPESEGYLVIYRDISQQKRVGSELQKRFEAIQDAYKELGLQRRYLDYLSEIIDLTVEKSTADEVHRLIVSAFSLLTKSDCAILRLYDNKKNILKLQTTFGVNTNWNTKDQIKFKNSIAEEAFKLRRAIIINDIDSYRKHQGLNLLKTHKLKTLILLPLYIEDRLIGTISLYATDPAKFRLIETDFLERMSRQSALAIFTKQNLHS